MNEEQETKKEWAAPEIVELDVKGTSGKPVFSNEGDSYGPS